MAGALITPPSELSEALLNGAGWAINLAVAKWHSQADGASSAQLYSMKRGDLRDYKNNRYIQFLRKLGIFDECRALECVQRKKFPLA